MDKENIIIIRASKRRENVDSLQKVLTEFGCIIKTRLGLHEADNVCSDEGLIILQLSNNDNEELERFKKALTELKGITYKALEI